MPFGGGTRRCVGAAFANMELDVVLRTVLRHFVIQTTSAPGEKVHNRGVAFTPKKGGRVVVFRRAVPLGLTKPNGCRREDCGSETADERGLSWTPDGCTA